MNEVKEQSTCGAETSNNDRCERPVNSPDDRCFQHKDEKLGRDEFEEQLAEYKNELSEFESKKEELDDEISKVLSGVDPDEEKASKIQDEIDDLEKKIRRKKIIIENFKNQVSQTVEKNEARDLIDELTQEIETVNNEHNEAVQEFETVKDEFLELAEIALTSFRRTWRLEKSIEALCDSLDLEKPELDLPPSPSNSELFQAAKDTPNEIDELVKKSNAYRNEGEFIRRRKSEIEAKDGEIFELINLIRTRFLN